MALGKKERATIEGAIRRLRGEQSSPEVAALLLTGPARLYLETWVIAPLELLARADRKPEDLELASRLAGR